MSRIKTLITFLLAMLLLAGGVVAAVPSASLQFTDGILKLGAKPASGQALVGGSSVAGGTVAVAYGGTGATTAAGARSGLGIEGLRTDADPVLCTDSTIVYTGSASPVLPDAASCGAGQRILVYANAAATLTLTRAGSDTIDGGTTSAITLQAGEGRVLLRESAGAWRSVQAGSVDVRRIVADISAGAWRAAGYAKVGGSFVRVTNYVAPEASQDPESWGFSLSGADISLTTGAGIINTVTRTEAPGWSWALSTFGVTVAAGPRITPITVEVSSISLTGAGASDDHGVAGCYSTALDLSTGALYATGVGRASSNYSQLADDADTAVNAFAVSTTLRKEVFTHQYPLVASGPPYGYRYASGDSFLSAGTTPACASSGTPTHIGIFLVRLTAPRAGTIAAPTVTWDL